MLGDTAPLGPRVFTRSTKTPNSIVRAAGSNRDSATTRDRGERVDYIQGGSPWPRSRARLLLKSCYEREELDGRRHQQHADPDEIGSLSDHAQQAACSYTERDEKIERDKEGAGREASLGAFLLRQPGPTTALVQIEQQ